MWLLAVLGCGHDDGVSDVVQVDCACVAHPDDTSVTDVITVASREPELDVLVAIDPDPELRARFADVLPGLLAGFDDVDPRWRVAFTSTALGGALGWLAPTGVDGGSWLSREDLEDPSVDWSGAPADAPLGATGATYRVVDGFSDGFRRPEAALQLIVVTRAPDETPASIVTFEAWTEWIGLEDAVVFAAVPAGDPIRDVVTTTGGVAVDVDDELDPWTQQVTIASVTPFVPFHLSVLPLLGTVEVQVELPDGTRFLFSEAAGDPPVGDWSYVPGANAVQFLEYVPPAESKVVANYEPLDALTP
jgi:hypothetical protein